MLRREFIKLTSSMRLLLTTVLFILLMINSLFGQSERPNSVVTPISSIGELSENRNLILQNTLTDELKEHFMFVKLNKVFSDPFGLIEEEINLDSLTNITGPIASVLANHEGNLRLNNLSRLTVKAAESLAKVQGGLYLNGLAKLTPPIARALLLA